MENIKGKWALITGASSGIGEAVAKKLASEGCNLILCARKKEKLEILKKDFIKNYGIKVEVFSVDVRLLVSVNIFTKNVRNLGITPHFLINNAGLAKGLEPVQNGIIDNWEAMIDTNLKGLLYITKSFLSEMIKQGSGHIVNIGSTAGWQTYPGGNVYNATKFGVRALSDAMSLDLVNTDIKVSCVAPGSCETNFTKVRFNGDENKSHELYSSYKSLEAKDVADMIFYILNAPEHVNIPYVRIMAKDQRNSYVIRKNIINE